MSDVKVTIDLVGTETPRFRGGRTLAEIRAEAEANRQKKAQDKADRESARKAKQEASKAQREQNKEIAQKKKEFDRATREQAKSERDQERAQRRFTKQLDSAQQEELSAREAAIDDVASVFGLGKIYNVFKTFERIQTATQRVENLTKLGNIPPERSLQTMKKLSEGAFSVQKGVVKGLSEDVIQAAINKASKTAQTAQAAGASRLGSVGGAASRAGMGGSGAPPKLPPGGVNPPSPGGGGFSFFGAFGGKAAGMAGLVTGIGFAVLALDALVDVASKVASAFMEIDRQLDSNIQRLAEYGGVLSVAQATRDIARIQNEMRQARELAGPGASYLRNQTKFETELIQAQTELYKVLLPIAEAIKNEVIIHLKNITAILELLNAIEFGEWFKTSQSIASWTNTFNLMDPLVWVKFSKTLYDAMYSAMSQVQADEELDQSGVAELDREMMAFFGMDAARVFDPKLREDLPEFRGVLGE